MRMRWCPSVTRAIVMMGMLLLFLLLLLASTAECLDTGQPQQRSKRQSSACEAKYSEYSSSHTLCLTDVAGAEMVTLSQETKDDIVNYHNELRANATPTPANMMKLVWDEKLERTAKKWVMQCPTDHDQMKDRMEPDWRLVKIGQNLGMGHATFRAMITRFYSEKERMNYVYGGPYIDGAGHFYQIVTARTNRIGCGQSFCKDTRFKRFRVCNYAVALDAGNPPYNSGATCADCPNHCDSSGKLCDCAGKLCYSNGRLDPATCECRCQQGRTGENCEMVDCDQEDPFSSCRNGVIPESACGNSGVVKDRTMCPHLCGLCGQPCAGKECHDGYTLDTDSCDCECRIGREIGGKCEKCLEIQCQNLGTVSDCGCSCYPGWSGPYCEVCPSTDHAQICAAYTNATCSSDNNQMAFCPYMCGVCPTVVPGGGDDAIPDDYDPNIIGSPDVQVTGDEDAGSEVTDSGGGDTDSGVTGSGGGGDKDDMGTATHSRALLCTQGLFVALALLLGY